MLILFLEDGKINVFENSTIEKIKIPHNLNKIDEVLLSLSICFEMKFYVI